MAQVVFPAAAMALNRRAVATKTGSLEAAMKVESPRWPELPPIATVIPGFDAKAWGGIMVPAATPKPIIERLAQAIERVMTAPDIDERFVQINNEIDYKPTEEFAAYLREQKAKFADIIRRANIRIEQ